MTYLSLKFVHVFMAIVGVGSSAGLLAMLGLSTGHATHAVFALRTIQRLLYAIGVPGYVLMLVSGMWMGHVADLLDARWTEAAMDLWGIGALFMALTLFAMRAQLRSIESQDASSPVFRRAVRLGRVGAVGWAGTVVAILYFMVFKPV